MLDDGAKLVHSQGDQSSDLATSETFIELPEGHFGSIALPAVGEGLRVDNPINEVQQNNREHVVLKGHGQLVGVGLFHKLLSAHV